MPCAPLGLAEEPSYHQFRSSFTPPSALPPVTQGWPRPPCRDRKAIRSRRSGNTPRPAWPQTGRDRAVRDPPAGRQTCRGSNHKARLGQARHLECPDHPAGEIYLPQSEQVAIRRDPRPPVSKPPIPAATFPDSFSSPGLLRPARFAQHAGQAERHHHPRFHIHTRKIQCPRPSGETYFGVASP